MAGNSSQAPSEAGPSFSFLNSNAQSEVERREIRQSYRKLLDDLNEQKQVLTDPSDAGNALQHKLDAAEKLFDRVKQPREATLDSKSLVQLADFGKKKAQALQINFVRFQPFDFCERLKVAIGGELDTSLSAADWQGLGKNVERMFYKTPILKYMCGSFERGEVNLTRSRPPRVKEPDTSAKATQPTQLSSFAEAGRGELTTAHVENLLSTLWRRYDAGDKGPLDFFEFVTHPTSFGQTVENIFYTSFLVRDGHAKVSLDDDELPMIEPIERDESTDITDETLHKDQVILNLTPQKWKEIVTAFNIETPVIEPVKIQES